MRSSPNKITKPPPPVPPRPNKNVIAEALAKTRKPLPDQSESGTTTTSAVTRPPISATVKPSVDAKACVMVKTQSYYPVNYCNIKPKQDDPPSPAASYESAKPMARTIIYQSNVVSTVVTNAKINNACIESLPINGCIVNNNAIRTVKTKSSTNTGASISRTDSFKSKSSGSQHFEITNSSNSIHCSENSMPENLPKNNNGTGGNWTDILNDRNHVNTLIDEMFASVLDQPAETNDDVIQTINDGVLVPSPYRDDDSPILSNDTATTITISDGNYANGTTTIVESFNGSIADMKKVVTFQEESSTESNTSTQERKPLRNDRQNHEQLIAELATMNHEKNINRRQRRPTRNANLSEDPAHRRIQHSDWVEVTKTGQEVRLSSCQITIDEKSSGVVHKNNVNLKLSGPDEGEDSSVDSVISRCTNMSSGGNMNTQGLPPLPKSLSGFSIMMENSNLQNRNPAAIGSNMVPHLSYTPHLKTPSGVVSNGTIDSGSLKKESNLESKLALLRREMYSLRQLDLSLLSQLWSLNESIQDFRQMLQDNEERGCIPLSPPSPSPTPSSAGDDGHDGAVPLDDEDEEDDIEDEDEDSTAPFFTPRPMRYRPAPPPPPSNVAGSAAGGAHHRRTSNSSSGTSSV